VIGDGALTGGMAWEALNNIAARRPAGWSSSSTTTAGPTRRPSAASPRTRHAAHHPRYEQVLDTVKRLNAVPASARRVRRAARHEEGPQGRVAPQGLFEDLGLKYVGPVDGHDREAARAGAAQAKRSAAR
jgi:1-deoxy-D-xylulose-5-phosphate synthase